MPAHKGRVMRSVLSFHENVKKAAKRNLSFRKVFYRGKFSELAAISMPLGAELGEDIHANADEILFVVQGIGRVNVDGRIEKAKRNDAIFIAAGQHHNLTNVGRRDLKLLCVCSPPSSRIKGGIHKRGVAEMREQIRYAWEQ